MTRYIDVSNVQELVSRLGAATMMSEMAGFIREDFLRWEQFQKSARTANHSEVGVIRRIPHRDSPP
jgi:ornithine cyclodeaminase